MLKVVVIDDESVVRKGIVLGVDWTAMDCVVVGEASNGEGGLLAIEQYNPNLIITDIRMPKMDGIEMVTELRKRGNRAHVIVLTAYDDFQYVRSALQLGAVDYLLKPFRNPDLEAAISRVMEKEKDKSAMKPEDMLPLAKGDKSKYVLEALNYIAEHYNDNDISITPIAHSLGVSESHLSHVFKKETSYTIISYLTQYRIHMAMKLLQDCRYKVYEVSEMVGYRDVAYFGSTFKNINRSLAIGISGQEQIKKTEAVLSAERAAFTLLYRKFSYGFSLPDQASFHKARKVPRPVFYPAFHKRFEAVALYRRSGQ